MIRRVPGGWVDVNIEGFASPARFKIGEVYPCDIVEMHNGAFFRKWWALVTTVYEIWKDRMPEKIIGGKQVATSMERFRKDITILAGYYEPVYNVKGEVRLEAASISWSKMKPDVFEKLYSDTISAALHKILPDMGLTPDDLDDWAQRVLRFA